MMRSIFAVQLVFVLSAPVSLDAATAAVVSSVPPPVALISASNGLVEWTPLVESDGITLALADPQGLVRTIQFAPGEAPVLSLLDIQGAPLPDGTYTWEIRIAPRLSADLKREIEDARSRGDEEQLTRLNRLAAPLVQSGYFTVANGSLVAPSSAEQPEKRRRQKTSQEPEVLTAPDQVVPDDLIVDGKGCIGLGCENNEAFGDEALRLRQSVVRLRFLDTSTQAGFPARDWQLTINDSASGGADRFSLEDLTAATTPLTVRGGAPNNSLYVDGVGNLGLGTATPAQDLHVASGSTPTLRLEQTGVTARTWDVGANDADFFVRDVTGGLTLPFQIKAGAPNDTLVVGSNGRVGIGTNTPAVRLDVKVNVAGQATARLQNSSATGYSAIEYLDEAGNVDLFFGLDPINSATRLNSRDDKPIVILTNSVERMRITSSGNVGIGTADPQASLHVNTGEVRFPGGVDSVNGFSTHFRYSGDGKNYLRGSTILADDGGNVGIGISIPASKLHVNGGDIRVSGGSFIDDGTTLNVPDYVFEPSYKLMPLQELATFVAEKRHLPNVPNAEDIQREGLNLSDFPIRLLEKVEELALYTINQQRQIDGLMAENAELKARLVALEAESK